MTSVQQPPDGAPEIVRLPANCATVAAEELRTQLVLAAGSEAGTIVDASAVQTVGQAVLQLLVTARVGAAGRGENFTFSAMSDAFAERVRAVCLADLLGIETTGEGQAS